MNQSYLPFYIFNCNPQFLVVGRVMETLSSNGMHHRELKMIGVLLTEVRVSTLSTTAGVGKC